MRIYGPADVLAAADQVRHGLADGADQARELLELVPRLVGLVRRAEALIEAAERTLARTDEVVEAADLSRRRVDEVSERASALLDRGEHLVGRSESLVGRGEALLALAEGIVPDALPLLGQVIDAIDPAEVRAVNDIIDRLPAAVDQMDRIGPDVHQILESVTDLSQAIKGFPGMGALIRRGERKEDEAAEDSGQTDTARELAGSSGTAGDQP